MTSPLEDRLTTLERRVNALEKDRDSQRIRIDELARTTGELRSIRADIAICVNYCRAIAGAMAANANVRAAIEADPGYTEDDEAG